MDRRAFLASTLALSGAAALVPGRAFAAPSGRRVPQPTAALVTQWNRDPWSRGAYSALPPGVSPNIRWNLAEALLGGRIALAGEYVSESAPATTTGAERSGRRAAALVLEEVEPANVIVIGAGMAGAAAAHALAAAGAQVTVLEARDRIGGRIHTDMSWGVPVELGAAWVHGTTGNPVAALAKANGLGLVPTNYDDSQVRDTMTGRPSSVGARTQDRLAALVRQCEDGDGPTRQSVAQWLRGRGWRSDRIGTWATSVELTQEYGLDPSQLGVRALQEGADQRGGDALVSGGYSHIPSSLLQGLDVRLSSPVSHVSASSGAVSVTLADGSVMSADAVIVAVPVSLLQQQVLTIDPMPAHISAAIKSLRTGDLEKVILRYDSEWWDDYTVFGVIGGGVPGVPAGSLASLRWTEFYPLTHVLGFPSLVGFSGGAAAMAEPRDAQAIATEAVSVLDSAFGASGR